VRIFEIDDNDPLRVKLTAIVSQLRSEIKKSGFKKPYSLKAMISRLRDQGIAFSEQQFRDMAEQEPLSNLISNIDGDAITFKGTSTDDNNDAIAPGPESKTLEKMADRAADKRD
jgi:hypothetical protein